MASPTIGPVVGNSDSGTGVLGTSNTNDGVVGRSTSAFGVFGASVSGVGIRAVSETSDALQAQAKGKGVGVSARSGGGTGVLGVSDTDDGVAGRSTSAFGVFGASVSGVGIRAVSETGDALQAQAKGNGVGVSARSGGGTGVLGVSDTEDGVAGRSTSAFGVFGASVSGVGIRAVSETGAALQAEAKGNGIGVDGHSKGGDGVFGTSATGVGVHGQGGQLAGFFEGSVKVTGVLQCEHEVQCNGNILMAKTGDIKLMNADCAEDFDVSGTIPVEPGTVMVLGCEGDLCESRQAYDKRVAGVISGAGSYKPGIVLDKQDTEGNRQPIALIGKAYCKVDAQFGAIEVGDLLTTSPTPGHAMKASDPMMAFGAVIGKALRPLPGGQGLVPILITLQ